MTDRHDNRAEPSDEPIRIEAEDARAGDVVLRKPWERAVFIAGLVAFVVLAALAAWWVA